MPGIIVVDANGNALDCSGNSGGLAIPTAEQVQTVLSHGGADLALPNTAAVMTAIQEATKQRCEGKTLTLDAQRQVFELVTVHHLEK